MSDDPAIEDDGGAPLAAEYALGVLGADERRDFERRLASEPALRAETEFWERRLGALAAEVKSIDPPPDTWSKFESALQTSNRLSSRTATASSNGIWQSVAFWRWTAVGSAAVAAASLFALAYLGHGAVSSQPLIAKLQVSGDRDAFVAVIDPGRSGLTVVPAAVANIDQRVLELWFIVPGGQPRSLGLIEPGRPIHINLPPEILQLMTPDTTLAVSLEPRGGSPTGLPTGPVIANGKLTNL